MPGFDQGSFADSAVCANLWKRINEAAREGPPVTLMEVCGTHTTAFFRHGIRGMLPPRIRLISGPGCPVCVTPTGYVDLALRLMREPGIALVTFGDMVRVPGSRTSIERERGRGGRVHVVYSPMDALDLARREPQTTFVFLGVGFETTAPTVAQTILRAESEGVGNLRVLVGHKLVPPALRALLANPDIRIDGFILPGHVSVIIGSEAYRFVAEEFGVAGAICGFEPVDLLQGVLSLLEAQREPTAHIVNRYGRFVTPRGNQAALAALYSAFEAVDTDWRGLGRMAGSGLALRSRLAHRDASSLLGDDEIVRIAAEARDDPACRCGEVLCGTIAPGDCSLFGSGCTPEMPIGPCMVSTEGTCAAYFKYGRLEGTDGGGWAS